MANPETERLPSAYLEDLAYIVLSARADRREFELYPDISSEMRVRLRSRLKQLGRYDWPSSLRDDSAIRRGPNLRQCCRIIMTLLLLDAHLPPSLAVELARNNEVGFLRAISARIECQTNSGPAAHDLLAVLLPAEIQESIEPHDRARGEERVRFVQRVHLGQIWTEDCAGSGGRLVIDISTVAAASWRWISERRLMTDGARVMLQNEVEEMKTGHLSNGSQNDPHVVDNYTMPHATENYA